VWATLADDVHHRCRRAPGRGGHRGDPGRRPRRLRQLLRDLRDRGADLSWVGWDDLTPLDIAEAQGAGEVVAWLRSQGARSATELR
jgi:hypothetical protein